MGLIPSISFHIIPKSFSGIPSGTAGLAFSMALGLTGMTQVQTFQYFLFLLHNNFIFFVIFKWGVRQSAEVEVSNKNRKYAFSLINYLLESSYFR